MKTSPLIATVRGLVLALLVGIALYVFTRALHLIFVRLFLPDTFGIYSKLVRPESYGFTFVLNGMIYPIVEEFIFRRKLYGFLLPRFGTLSSMMLATAAFCLLHVELYGKFLMINILLLGIVCQLIVNSSGSILTSATCHGAFNICAMIPKRSVADIQSALGMSEIDALWPASLVALAALATMFILLLKFPNKGGVADPMRKLPRQVDSSKVDTPLR